MKLSRRANTIILWFVSIGLLAGMVITFTPSLGLGFGRNDAGSVAFRVNGEPIRDLQVAQARSNPLFLAVTEGEVGADLELLLADSLIRQEVVRQEGARQRVSDTDVRRAVDEFRVSRGVAGRANDSAYLNQLAGAGFTDETFRVYLRGQLQQERWEASIVDGVELSDEEVRAFFDSYRDGYLSEERIEARHIVTLGRDEAEAARDRIVNGEDVGAVAREVSVERGDRDGALGAAAGESAPRPVGRAALPTPVATAAFGLAGPGVTDVIESGERFHLVVVEAYLPAAQRPFDEVAADVRDDALATKQAGVLEAAIDRLVAAARVEIPADGILGYADVPVARVGTVDIMASDLVRATYTNPQIQQALSPETAFIISAFFKPSVLAQLVDQELVLQSVDELGVPFVGPRSFVAQSALNYVARDAVADEEAIVAYYEQNLDSFTIPASAEAVQVNVTSLEDAAAFRSGLLDEGDLEAVAERVGAEVIDHGLVVPGRLGGLLDVTLFGTDAFEDVPGTPWAVSDLLVLSDPAASVLPEQLDVETEEPEELVEVAVERYTLLVAQRRPERVRPLDEVRPQIAATVLAEARSGLREAWLAELREATDVVPSLLEEPEGFSSGLDVAVGADDPADGVDEPAGDDPGEAEGDAGSSGPAVEPDADAPADAAAEADDAEPSEDPATD